MKPTCDLDEGGAEVVVFCDLIRSPVVLPINEPGVSAPGEVNSCVSYLFLYLNLGGNGEVISGNEIISSATASLKLDDDRNGDQSLDVGILGWLRIPDSGGEFNTLTTIPFKSDAEPIPLNADLGVWCSLPSLLLWADLWGVGGAKDSESNYIYNNDGIKVHSN